MDTTTREVEIIFRPCYSPGYESESDHAAHYIGRGCSTPLPAELYCPGHGPRSLHAAADRVNALTSTPPHTAVDVDEFAAMKRAMAAR